MSSKKWRQSKNFTVRRGCEEQTYILDNVNVPEEYHRTCTNKNRAVQATTTVKRDSIRLRAYEICKYGLITFVCHVLMSETT